MPITSSGIISLGRSGSTVAGNSAGHRLGYASGQYIDMNNADVRGLAEVSGTSGSYWTMASLYGKPSWAYSRNYDCSTFNEWSIGTDPTGGDTQSRLTIYGGIHWKYTADGNATAYAYQTRRLDIANSFDLTFDVMQNNFYNPVQIQIGANSNLAGGGGFRYNANELYNESYTSPTHIGTQGTRLMVWFQAACIGPSTSPYTRINYWTRLRFVGTRSGSTWSGTVTATAAYYDNAVLGTAAFSFTNSGQYIAIRSYANADGGGEACFVDNMYLTLD